MKKYLIPVRWILSAALVFLALTAIPMLQASAYDTVETDEGETFVTVGTVEEAGDYLREQMTMRESPIRFIYTGRTSENTLPPGLRPLIWEEALKITDAPNEGDYLRYSIRNYTSSIDLSSYHVSGETAYLFKYEPTYLTTYDEEMSIMGWGLIIKSGWNSGISMVYEGVYDVEDIPEADRVRLVYDYIAQTVYYDHEGYQFEVDQVEAGVNPIEYAPSHTAYSALKSMHPDYGPSDSKAVCQGYGVTAYYLLKMVGIDCRFIRGEENKNNADERSLHDVNLVKVDGKWYFTDFNYGAMFKEQAGGAVGDVDYSWFLKCADDFVYHYYNTDSPSGAGYADNVPYYTDDPSYSPASDAAPWRYLPELYCLTDPTNSNYTEFSWNDDDSRRQDGYAPSYTFYDLQDNEISPIAGKYAVITFFRPNWVNEDFWLPQIAASHYFNDSDFIFYAVDISRNPEKSVLRALETEYGFGDNRIMYISSGKYRTATYLEGLLTRFLTACGYSEDYDFSSFSFNLPVTFLIDSNGRINYVFTAGREDNGNTLVGYLTAGNLDRKIAYMLANPLTDTRPVGAAPTTAMGVGERRPGGTGEYAGGLSGVTEDLEYRVEGSNIWYPGTSDGTISGLTPGSYYVRRSATNTAKASEEVEVVVVPSSVRSGMSAARQPDGSIALSWTAVPKAVCYEVYRLDPFYADYPSPESLLDHFEPVGTTTGTSFTDLSPTPGVCNYYRIKSAIADSKGLYWWSDFYGSDSSYAGATPVLGLSFFRAGTKITEFAMPGHNTTGYTIKAVASGVYSDPVLHITDVSLSDTTIADMTLYDAVLDGSGNVTTKEIKLYPHKGGTAEVIVTLSSGDTFSLPITSPASISLSETVIDLSAGESYALTPTLAKSTYTVTWSADDPSKARVSASGVVTGISEGNTYVIATANGESASVLVNVTGTLAAPAISAQPADAVVQLGETTSFSVTGAGGAALYQWQYSDDGGATWNDCSESGCETPTLTVTAALGMNRRLYHCVVSNGIESVTSDTAELTAVPATVKSGMSSVRKPSGSIDVAWNAVAGAEGYQIWRGTEQNNYSTYMLVGTVTGTSFTDTSPVFGGTNYYRVKSGVADNSGNWHYSEFYTDYIGWTGVTPAIGLSFYRSGIVITEFAMERGVTYTLKALASGTYPDETITDVSLSVKGFAEMTVTGDDRTKAITLRAQKRGNADLIVTLSGGDTFSLPLTAPAGISFGETTLDLTAGSSATLTPTLAKPGYPITWRVGNSAIANVSDSGVVTGLSAGNTYVYAAVDGDEAKVLVKVSGSITPLSLGISSKDLLVGNSFVLTPVGGSGGYTWRVGDSAKATVDSSGKVTCISEGNTYLYCKDSLGTEVKCLLKITKPLSIKYSEKSLKIGETFQFTATGGKSAYTWRIGNTAIAAVDSTGKVTGITAGNTYLYCKDSSGKEVKCLLKITASALSIRYSEKGLKIGDSFQFAATGGKYGYTWRVGNSSVATVDTSGKVTAKSGGNTYLYCKDSAGVEVKCLLKVTSNALSIRYTSKTIKVGDTFTFTATGGKAPYTWRMGNTDKATVGITGVVTGVSVGNTYLYCYDSDGTEVKCLLKITG